MKTKIIGLLNLNELFVYEKEPANFENAVNAAYKLSEDGADGIVIYGNSFRERLKLFLYLSPKMDIFASPFIKSEKQFNNFTKAKKNVSKNTILFSNKKISGTFQTIIPENLEFLRNKDGVNALLITNKNLLKIFHTERDFIPEFSALVSEKVCELDYKYLILEEVLSAEKGAEFCKKLKYFT
jgi:hypothetical protein